MNNKEIGERSQDREYKQRWRTDKKHWRENIKLKGEKESDKKNVVKKDEKRMVLRKITASPAQVLYSMESSRYRGGKGEGQMLYWLEKPHFLIIGNASIVAASFPNIRSLMILWGLFYYCFILCLLIITIPSWVSLKIHHLGASLVAQWLRICLPMQGTWVRALVWEDPTCRGATRPVSHNYWACVSGACAPQEERPR